jgi:hypothetical protein
MQLWIQRGVSKIPKKNVIVFDVKSDGVFVRGSDGEWRSPMVRSLL